MTEKILKFLFFFGLLFLVFLAGIVAAINKTYFYWKIQEIYLFPSLALRAGKEIRGCVFLRINSSTIPPRIIPTLIHCDAVRPKSMPRMLYVGSIRMASFKKR